MQASDVMTRDVISVSPDTSVRELAELLIEHRISAAPVLENGKLVGIASEGDMVRRAELGTAEQRRPWWLDLLTSDASRAGEYVRTHSQHVRDVMTPDVTTVTEETPLTEIATILEGERIKRVPVVSGEQVVGIVSRADLIQRLAAQRDRQLPGSSADDATIRLQVLAALREQDWSPMTVTNAMVTDGTVELFGLCRSEEERDASRVAAENVPGVQRVIDHRTPTTTPYGEH